MIKDCTLNLECRLIETLEFPTNYFFVGEIIAAYSEEQYLTQGKPDIKKMEPLLPCRITATGPWGITGEKPGKQVKA
ncbi:flavoredoxin [Methanosarcina lacustris Z-7289]|uniref:Flavoredoxin n=1 Tax=Methanosarcina lacustris Z-7289 TaxID=1434111 RepID=A0A0E3RYZ5_9EURY|nr:flavoredoxin [Methanosarcina lacustris Z-7289]